VSPFVLATIVEGDGEVRALPVLIRRLRPLWQVPNPIRLPRTKAIDRATDQPRPDVLARYLAIARARVQEHGGRGAVLLLYDSDDSCAATLGPRLRQQAESSLAGLRCQAVLACREFEAWFLAAGIVDWTGDPESPRDAKGIVARALGYSARRQIRRGWPRRWIWTVPRGLARSDICSPHWIGLSLGQRCKSGVSCTADNRKPRPRKPLPASGHLSSGHACPMSRVRRICHRDGEPGDRDVTV
jgi:hypothetical protein